MAGGSKVGWWCCWGQLSSSCRRQCYSGVWDPCRFTLLSAPAYLPLIAAWTRDQMEVWEAVEGKGDTDDRCFLALFTGRCSHSPLPGSPQINKASLLACKYRYWMYTRQYMLKRSNLFTGLTGCNTRLPVHCSVYSHSVITLLRNVSSQFWMVSLLGPRACGSVRQPEQHGKLGLNVPCHASGLLRSVLLLYRSPQSCYDAVWFAVCMK